MTKGITRNQEAFVDSFNKLKKEQSKRTNEKMTTGAIADRTTISSSYFYHLVSKKNPRPLTVRALKQIVWGLRLTQKQASEWIKKFTPKDKFQPVLIQDVSTVQKYGKQMQNELSKSHTEKELKTIPKHIDNALVTKRVKRLMKDNHIARRGFDKKINWDAKATKQLLSGKFNFNKLNKNALKIKVAFLAKGLGVKDALSLLEPKADMTASAPVQVTAEVAEKTLSAKMVTNAKMLIKKNKMSQSQVISNLQKQAGWSMSYARRILEYRATVTVEDARKLAHAINPKLTISDLLKNTKASRSVSNKIKNKLQRKARTQARRKQRAEQKTERKAHKATKRANHKKTAKRTHKNTARRTSRSAKSSSASRTPKRVHKISVSHKSSNTSRRSTVSSNFHQVNPNASHKPVHRNSAKVANHSNNVSTNNNHVDMERYRRLANLDDDTIELAEQLQKLNPMDKSIIRVNIARTLSWQHHLSDLTEKNRNLTNHK